ncbi:MAG: CopG family antitoxin [Akkermansia sp.]
MMDELTTIEHWGEIPVFESLPEESAFWQAHDLSPYLMESSLLMSDNRESSTITLRFDPRMLARIKRVARGRYLNYQSMMKQWLAERLDDEVRSPDEPPSSLD